MPLPLSEQIEIARKLVDQVGGLASVDQAIAACDEVLTRFGTAAELELREQVASALVIKGIRLNEIGRGKRSLPMTMCWPASAERRS